MTPYDAIVVGGGHNGLVTAAYLARAGLRTVVLERNGSVGGAAVTEQIRPGFRVDTAAHRLGPLRREVLADLRLEDEGLRIVRADPTAFALQRDGPGLLLWRDPAACARSIRPFSPHDAGRWEAFTAHMHRAARVLAAIHALTPPTLHGSNPRDLWEIVRSAGLLRRHGRAEAVELLRLLPMSVAELLDEWFESEALKGALGAVGVTGVFQGPLASGTAYIWLRELIPCGAMRPMRWAMGGMGSFTEALARAARRHGAEIRTSAPVRRILVRDGTAAGVVLESGEEIRARRVISSADPRHTFLNLLDPLELDPEFLRQVRNVRYRGACAKVNLALGELPNFFGAPDDVGSSSGSRTGSPAGTPAAEPAGAAPHLRGAITLSPSLEYLERAFDDAKYGGVSREPYLEAFIPTVWDPSLAPAGSHVMSILVQYAPYRLLDGEWDGPRREALGDAVVATLGRYAPNLEGAILERQILTPADLETRFGLTEGHMHHGELTLDQFFLMRPVPGGSRYRAPIRGLYLCGAGAHPGGGVTGSPGCNAAREILKDARRQA
ncbi:MAG: phytoene desaturase family protein [Gemmatimonadota bacterium]